MRRPGCAGRSIRSFSEKSAVWTNIYRWESESRLESRSYRTQALADPVVQLALGVDDTVRLTSLDSIPNAFEYILVAKHAEVRIDNGEQRDLWVPIQSLVNQSPPLFQRKAIKGSRWRYVALQIVDGRVFLIADLDDHLPVETINHHVGQVVPNEYAVFLALMLPENRSGRP